MSPGAWQQNRIAVVYFSGSGTRPLPPGMWPGGWTPHLFEIQAPVYRLGVPGWVRAMMDARTHQSDIVPCTLDLTGFDTVYLGAPIWLYSPAPPIWEIVEHKGFDGKHGVLFNTFNSQHKSEYIDALKAKLLERGARTFEHRFVRRGRMTQQIGPDEMIRAVGLQWFIEDVAPRPDPPPLPAL